MKEGSLDAPVRHNVLWQEEEFYDEEKLDDELRRVFDISRMPQMLQFMR